MLFSSIALLAIAGSLAAAAPAAAQATYCSEDNLLRAFQHTPTPASRYCIATTGYPTFLAVTTYPSTRLSSACSCFSRIPSETPKAPACTPNTKFSLSGTANGGAGLNLVITTSPTTPCGSGGITITDVCGTYNNGLVSFGPAETSMVQCLTNSPPSAIMFTTSFTSSTGDVIFLTSAGELVDITAGQGYGFAAPPVVLDVSCSGSSTCPAA